MELNHGKRLEFFYVRNRNFSQDSPLALRCRKFPEIKIENELLEKTKEKVLRSIYRSQIKSINPNTKSSNERSLQAKSATQRHDPPLGCLYK